MTVIGNSFSMRATFGESIPVTLGRDDHFILGSVQERRRFERCHLRVRLNQIIRSYSRF